MGGQVALFLDRHREASLRRCELEDDILQKSAAPSNREFTAMHLDADRRKLPVTHAHPDETFLCMGYSQEGFT